MVGQGPIVLAVGTGVGGWGGEGVAVCLDIGAPVAQWVQCQLTASVEQIKYKRTTYILK